jgi:hypothetical protein
MELIEQYQVLLASISAAHLEIEQSGQKLFENVELTGSFIQGGIASDTYAESDVWQLRVSGIPSPVPLTGTMTVGRALECDLNLTDLKVSRQHALVERRQGSFWIHDMDSHNGVYVNGSRIQNAVRLSVNDRIQLGDTLLRVEPAPQEYAKQTTMLNTQSPPTLSSEQVDTISARTCAKCGWGLSANARFCNKCGTPVD